MGKGTKRNRDASRVSGGGQGGGVKRKVEKQSAHRMSAGGGVRPSSKPGKGLSTTTPTKIAASRPPPCYRLSSAQTDEESSGHVLMPGDGEYADCLTKAYAGFHVDPPSVLPHGTHDTITTAFEQMYSAGYFQRDVLAAGNTVSPTFVRRTLVGNTGMTYLYQKLRIFAFPWCDDLTASKSPLRVVKALNDALVERARAVLLEHKDQRVQSDGSCDFNVTLINLMDPMDEALKSDVPLKNETKYGMGPTSVSWHSDSSLQPGSTVGVYHQAYGEGETTDPTWHVGLKTLDLVSPALRVPLATNSTYYMLRDFNKHHHHAVLAGSTKRYSSTHRVAVVAKDTFEYIKKRAVSAVGKSETLARYARDAKAGRNSTTSKRDSPTDENSLAKLTQFVGEVHRELEFQWIRMFWLQGQDHADRHAGYWNVRIGELTQAWDVCEFALRLILDTLRFASVADGAQSTAPTPPQRTYDLAVYVLQSISQARESHVERASSPAYKKLQPSRAPVNKPKFDDTSPLPENLRPAIAALLGWKKNALAKETGKRRA
jgi:alpha-ketoglutarate-dependent dioxygenase FTO|tara:strand:- start:309 stop:1940 length:1632 start_codon:yes stop_codon:yes gene_type:complete